MNDIVVLIRKVNEEWLYGKVGENEGMFPSNFIEIRVPLPDHNDKIVTCLYEFHPQALEDLKLVVRTIFFLVEIPVFINLIL